MSQENDIHSAQVTLKALQRKQQELAQQLSTTDFIWNGSISKRFLTCGKPACPCHTNPEAKHGPYYLNFLRKYYSIVSTDIQNLDKSL
jgi:hypothetical protein